LIILFGLAPNLLTSYWTFSLTTWFCDLNLEETALLCSIICVKKNKHNITNTSLKFKHLLKLLSITVLCLSIIPLMVVDCGSFNTHNAPQQTLQDLIESFSEEEAQQFNQEYNQNIFAQRIVLALVINLAIYTVVNYGPALYNNIVDVFHTIPQMFTDMTHFLVETAREAALRTASNATPEARARMLEIAQTILANRPTQYPPSA
jgi:hypothetical protein